MQRISWLPLLAGFLLLGIFESCKNKTDYQIPLDYNIYNNESKVTASFYGQVLDEAGMPVYKAQVSIGTNYTQTDTNGVFLFNLISAPSHNTTIRVAKADYVTGFRSMMVQNGAWHEARFTLLSNNAMKTFVASAGGTVSFGNDFKITFPAKAMVQQTNGQVYDGNVYVYARTINPSTNAGQQSMPGDLRSLRANMAEQAAYNYGMMHIALFDEAGNALALAPKIDAQLYRSPATSQMAGAPSVCMLSHYDEVMGIWRETSAAVMQAGQYIGP
ncbi:MAG: carboxypeptidase regulatory-like domain-containing protein, partial [Chitinophagaceae bacterium]|nr:carboxypeptidase regulatory-like domain-containing protein [Chitinophagaceae bacterium]